MNAALDIDKPGKTKRSKRTTDMTTGSPAKLLFYFAMPLFIGNILQQFYNLADTSLAGHLLGDTALAQIGATAALYSLITNVAFGLNNGFALFVSRSFGADNKIEMKRSVCWAVLLSAISTILLTTSFLVFRRPLLTLLQVPADTMDGALSYLTVILAGIPLTMAYNLESSLLRSIGNSVTPLIFLVFSSVLNVILDYLFMGPFSMGVRGAAIATVTSQGISAILGLFCILRGYPELRFGKQDMKVSIHFVFEMFWTGLSMALMSAIYNIGSVILQGSINALGNVYIAAQVGGRRLAEFFYTPGIALGTSAATFASQNYGAHKNSRIKKGIFAAITMYVVGACYDLHLHHCNIYSSADNRKLRQYSYIQWSHVSQNQHTDDTAYGGSRNSTKCPSGNVPLSGAAAVQRTGDDRQDNICSISRSSLRLRCRVRM